MEIRHNQKEILELKSTITQTKKLMDEIINNKDRAKETIMELRDILEKINRMNKKIWNIEKRLRVIREIITTINQMLRGGN